MGEGDGEGSSGSTARRSSSASASEREPPFALAAATPTSPRAPAIYRAPSSTQLPTSLLQLLEAQWGACASERLAVACGRCSAATATCHTRLAAPLPPILIFALSRFARDAATGGLAKNHAPITVPLALDVRPFLQAQGGAGVAGGAGGGTLYKLQAMVAHLGSMAEGHYITFFRGSGGRGGRCWVCADDSHVEEVEEDSLLSPETQQGCYLCFYLLQPPPG